MTVLNQHDSFKINIQVLNEKKTTIISCSNSYFHLPFGELGGGGGQHIVIFHVVILLHVNGERKGSLPGHKRVKPGHYLISSFV